VIRDIFGFRRSISRILRNLAYVAVGVLAGCGEQFDAPLLFEQSEIELGVVRGANRVRHAFPFRVTGASEVVVSELKSSCQCIAATTATLGKPLRRGECGEIVLELAVDEYGGDFVGTVHVVTVPESPKPILLRVHGVASAHPTIAGTQPIPLKIRVGRPFVIAVDVVATKPEREAPYVPDLEQSRLGKFYLESHTMAQTQLRPQGAQIVAGIQERHSFQFRHDAARTVLNEIETLEIAWKGIEHRTGIAVRIHAIHPLVLLSPNPFLGFVKPGAIVEAKFAFAVDMEFPQDQVRCEPVSVNDGTATIVPTADGVFVRLTAPAVPGRFTQQWRLSCPDAEIEPMDLKISGIVRD